MSRAAARRAHDEATAAMAWLDQRGATFEGLPGFPGWYVARFLKDDGTQERWVCQDSPDDREQEFAQAFRERIVGARS